MITYKAIWLAILIFYFLDVVLILYLSAKLDDLDVNDFSLFVVISPLLLIMLVILPIALLVILLGTKINNLVKLMKVRLLK